MNNIPTDIYTILFDELDIDDLVNLNATNKYFNNELNSKQMIYFLSNKYQLRKATSFHDFIQKYDKMLKVYYGGYYGKNEK